MEAVNDKDVFYIAQLTATSTFPVSLIITVDGGSCKQLSRMAAISREFKQ